MTKNERIIFGSIVAENFLSIGPEAQTLDYTTGINIVKGKNHDEAVSNGAGKSVVVVDTLLWCLFGKTLRKIPNSGVINDQVKKGCSVTVRFRVGKDKYSVTRTIPTSLVLQKNGRKTDLSVEQTQKEINRVLRANYDLYRNLVAFNINKTEPFAATGADKKRKMWEYVLNIILYRAMSDAVKKGKSQADIDLRVDTEKFEGAKATLEAIKYSLPDLEHQISEYEKSQKKKLDEYRTRIKETAEKVKGYKDLKKEYQKAVEIEKQVKDTLDLIRNKMTSAMEEHSKVNSVYEVHQKAYRKMERCQTGVKCPTCGQDVTEEHIRSCLAELKNEIEKAYQPVKEKYAVYEQIREKNNKLAELFDKVTEKRSELHRKLSEIDSIRKNLEVFETEILAIKNDKSLERMKKSLSESREKSGKQEKVIEGIRKNLEKLKVYSDDYEICKTILSDSGIKEYVIGIILPFVNQKLDEYMSRMNTTYTVKFDDKLNETFTKVSGAGKERKYENFSEGEKKRIDQAMLLTFIDLAQMFGTISSNLLIFDELLDSSADSSGLSSFMEILYEKSHAENWSVWIISHREQITDIPVDREITVERRNDITTIL